MATLSKLIFVNESTRDLVKRQIFLNEAQEFTILRAPVKLKSQEPTLLSSKVLWNSLTNKKQIQGKHILI